MRTVKPLLPLLALTTLVSSVADLQAAPTPRTASARAAFVKANPCPAENRTPRSRACPGYVVDHIVPLCAGGADAPSNMQWQGVREARRKDVDERRQCALLRKKTTPTKEQP
jgi:hypothetical protein